MSSATEHHNSLGSLLGSHCCRERDIRQRPGGTTVVTGKTIELPPELLTLLIWSPYLASVQSQDDETRVGDPTRVKNAIH